MNYQQTITYLYNALPMFHRIGAAAYKPDLNNTIAICNLLNDPQKNLKCIHIAGTNGKGSVSNMLASVLQEAGYKTGLYTSPHLKDFRERIRINGVMISKKYITEFVEAYRVDFDRIQPSFFEMTVGLAFRYFADRKIDIAVIETGLGGRLDSTNVIQPLVSVITNIGYDHMNLLGNTLEAIAGEKAGIIKKNIPVVIGEGKKNTITVFKEKAKEENAPLTVASAIYKAEKAEGKKDAAKLNIDVHRSGTVIYKNLKLDLTGNYQLKNCCTVLQTIDVLNQYLKIKPAHIVKGLGRVSSNTGFAGRWQILSKQPLIIADTAHNEDGIREVLSMLKQIKYKRLHFVLGMVNDKAIDSILKMLPKHASYYFCKADIPRGLDATLLSEQAARYKLEGVVCKSVRTAVKAAKQMAEKNDLIFIGGSTFTVAEAI
jgi:dihydrofolate synthase/folylpolyglutamate synthase